MSTSYFNQAHDLHVQTVNITNQMTAVASKAFDHLHDNIAADAVHNSDDRCSIPHCYPETRKAVQEEIHSWITYGDNDDEPKKIMWLTGPAGCGKTAIAGSVAEACEDEGLLAGSFFFSSFAGAETRCTKRCLIATLAYCLLQHDGLQPLRTSIFSAIERDPSIFRKSLSAQLKALILKPLRDVWRQLVLSNLPKVVIIDGLDEVEAANSRQLGAREARMASEAEQVEIISMLLQAVHNPNFPFRVLVVTRPEPVIRDFFTHEAGGITREIFLDEKYDPDSDIALFLQVKFSEIRRRYKLPLSWPGEEVLDKLRNKASGQFIYAATVVRFLQTAGMHPQARLECILEARASSDTSVFSSLDTLYTQILNSSPHPISSARWIGAIQCTVHRPALFIRQLFQDYHGQADYLLENLASLISAPPIEDDSSKFTFYHKSLHDFLNDAQRCGSELHEAFAYGLHVLWRDRVVQILNGKSPAVPLAESAWPRFLNRFANLLYECQPIWLKVSEEMQTTYESVLTSCDIVWWVRTVSHPWNSSYVSERFVEQAFELAHQWCGGKRYKDFNACNPLCKRWGSDACNALCKRWRGEIFGVCKASGWRVPNVAAFLREQLQVELTHWQSGGRCLWSRLPPLIDPLRFESPVGSVNTPAGTLPSVSGDDYQSICRLAGAIYSRLREDWRERCMDQGSGFLRNEVERIMDELGVKKENMDFPFKLINVPDSDYDSGSNYESFESDNDSDND